MSSHILLLIFSAVCAAIGQFLFKVGATDRNSIVEFINIYIILGLLFYASGTVIWIFSLSRMRLVDVYGFTALTFVLVYIAGIVFLNERINYATGFGVMLVLAGLFMMTQGMSRSV